MFKTDEDRTRADWPLLQNGAVSLFWRPELVGEVQRQLALLDYEIAEISASSGWSDFKQSMSSVLRWEDQFGYAPWAGKMDALNDGLSGYPFGPSGLSALIIRDFNRLVDEDGASSRILLDLLEGNARDHLLWGRTLIILIQTNDNLYESGPLGGRAALWNPRESLYSSRGL